MKINHGLIAYTLSGPKHAPGIDVLHFCGYEQPPTKFDVQGLEEELNTDPEFGLVGRINKDVFVMEAWPELVSEMSAKYGDI